MSDAPTQKQNKKKQENPSGGSSGGDGPRDQEADRRAKLTRIQDEFGQDPFGQRVDGLCSLAAALAMHDPAADVAVKENAEDDRRPRVKVAGRVLAHRVMGNLIFLKLRDASGDMQIAVSKKAVGPDKFKVAKLLDLGDLAVACGAVGTTNKGETTVWAEDEDGFAIACKSLTPAVSKFEGHALSDKELRYRKRYVDLYSNPEVMQTFTTRSKLIKTTRDFLEAQDFIEVETPMMQAIPGGAAARPFTTHHNALDMDLYMRIAPELYLKRLLVGGMPKVFEINRNFRNEGLSPRHNPEFTMLELYEAFGDLYSVMDLTEGVFQACVKQIKGDDTTDLTLPFGDLTIDYGNFRRAKYLDLFKEVNGFGYDDKDQVIEKAGKLGIDTDGRDFDLTFNEVWEETVEATLVQPTFVIDYPASLCPLTKRKPDEPHIAERFELFVANMELANAYTELNDPDVQLENFTAQLDGEDDEEASFRNVDMDFVEALKVGMPPAGGLGIGIDRLVMLMTNSQSIRDVILFPLMRPQASENSEAANRTNEVTNK